MIPGVVARMRDRARAVAEVVMDSYASWAEHSIPLRAAAMSYYFLITLAPLVLVILYVLSKAVNAADPLSMLPTSGVSDASVDALTQISSVAQAYAREMGAWGPLVSAGIALVGATVLLGNFTGALDSIWESTPTGSGMRYFMRRRLLGAAGLLVIMLVGFGVAVFVGVANVVVGILEGLLETAFTLPGSLDLAVGGGWLPGFIFVAALLSLAYSGLPKRRIRWRDALLGSLLTAGAYSIGQFALGIYLNQSAIVSAWGALGSFVAIIIWIYYTMQVVLTGAELTRQLVLRAEKRRGDTGAQARDAGADI